MTVKIIRQGPKKQVMCNSCQSVMEYDDADVQKYSGTDMSGGPDGYERVKCPSEGCRGFGYIRSW